MKISQIISYAVVLCIGGGIGYLVGSSSNKAATNTPIAVVAPSPSKTVVPESTPIAETTTATEPATTAPSSTTTPISTASTAPVKPTATSTGSLPDADLCFTGDQLGGLLTQYAEEKEALNLWYDPALMTLGISHSLKIRWKKEASLSPVP